MFGKKDGKKAEAHSDKDVIGYIGRGMAIEGVLNFEGAVRIEGAFKGDIRSSGTLIVGEGGKVNADIHVNTAIITGEVRGRVTADKKTELSAPARVSGEIKTPTLIVLEGATFDGNVVMTGKGLSSAASAEPDAAHQAEFIEAPKEV
jgi:cytoskeletal protein CcmA (bactofilin family)